MRLDGRADLAPGGMMDGKKSGAQKVGSLKSPPGKGGMQRMDGMGRMASMGAGAARGGMGMYAAAGRGGLQQGIWSQNDDNLLVAIVTEFGQTWHLVADVLRSMHSMTGVFRRWDACKQRYIQIQKAYLPVSHSGGHSLWFLSVHGCFCGHLFWSGLLWSGLGVCNHLPLSCCAAHLALALQHSHNPFTTATTATTGGPGREPDRGPAEPAAHAQAASQGDHAVTPACARASPDSAPGVCVCVCVCMHACVRARAHVGDGKIMLSNLPMSEPVLIQHQGVRVCVRM